MNTAARPALNACDVNAGKRSSADRSGVRTALPDSYAAMHGPSPRLVCSCSYRSASGLDAATYRGRVPGAINVTPAPVIGRISTVRCTRWSRIPWMGKSVAIVRAKSLRTSARSWLVWSDGLSKPGPRASPSEGSDTSPARDQPRLRRGIRATRTLEAICKTPQQAHETPSSIRWGAVRMFGGLVRAARASCAGGGLPANPCKELRPAFMQISTNYCPLRDKCQTSGHPGMSGPPARESLRLERFMRTAEPSR